VGSLKTLRRSVKRWVGVHESLPRCGIKKNEEGRGLLGGGEKVGIEILPEQGRESRFQLGERDRVSRDARDKTEQGKLASPG